MSLQGLEHPNSEGQNFDHSLSLVKIRSSDLRTMIRCTWPLSRSCHSQKVETLELPPDSTAGLCQKPHVEFVVQKNVGATFVSSLVVSLAEHHKPGSFEKTKTSAGADMLPKKIEDIRYPRMISDYTYYTHTHHTPHTHTHTHLDTPQRERMK